MRLPSCLQRVFLATLPFLVATPSAGLERSLSVAPGIERWVASAACSIAYFNLCNGWVWLFQPSDGDRFGAVFEPCGEGCTLLQSEIFFLGSSSANYGFTGTIGVYAVDENDCPQGMPIASVPFLPEHGYNPVQWNIPIAAPFIVMVETSAWSCCDPMSRPVTDHPSAGPTGPPGCGVCYPTTRINRSFLWTLDYQQLCPGSPFPDPLCDPQLLMSVQMSCATEVESHTWGRLKGLFR